MYLRAVILLLMSLLSALAIAGLAQEAPPATLNVGRFGQVTLYHSASRRPPLVLFVSGDGGWNLGVVEMAKALAGLGAVVVGIDIVHYLHQLEQTKGECDDAAGDFAELGRVVRQRLELPQTPPLLVGYSSGATLGYAVLAQAPPGTFGGAISMGFCPDLPLTKPLCRGSGLAFARGPKGKGYSLFTCQGVAAALDCIPRDDRSGLRRWRGRALCRSGPGCVVSAVAKGGARVFGTAQLDATVQRRF